MSSLPQVPAPRQAVSSSQSALHKLPTEIRNMIYQAYFEGEIYDRGAKSNLFQVLFPDKLLYDEAVAVYFKTRGLLLDKDNALGFEANFRTSRLGLVKELRLDINIETNSRSTAPEDVLPPEQQEMHRFLDRFIASVRPSEGNTHVNGRNTRSNAASRQNQPPPRLPRTKLSSMPNIHHLTLQFRVHSQTNTSATLGALRRFDRVLFLLEKFLTACEQLKELRIVLLMAGASGFAANFFDKVHVLLGVQGELVRGMRRDGSGPDMGLGREWGSRYSRTDEWVWKAAEGEGREGRLRKVGDVRGRDGRWEVGAW